jgi:hypothetical protein
MAAPTWNDIYTPWLAAHKAQFGGQDINRDWNRDEDSRRQKEALDKQYLDTLAAYAAQTGEQVAPDPSVLGVNAQPNTFTETDHSHDGFFGPVAKALGMSTNDLGMLAAVAAGGYGLYSGGLLGGAASGASGAASGAFAGSTMPAFGGLAAGDLALATMPQAVGAGGALAGGGSIAAGAAGGAGLLSTLGGAAKTAGGFLKDNPILGQIGGALLGAAAGQDSTTSSQKDPWAPAQPYLKQNLQRNAGMQDYYAKNPFSTEQKTAYQGLLDTLANNQANAPAMAGMANSFMGSNRGLLSNMPQFTQGTKAAPVDWTKYQNIGLMGG